MWKRRLLGWIGAGFAAVMTASGATALSIDTTVGWDGTTLVGSFGETNTATYGQVITADATDDVLNSFTFYLNDQLNTDFVDFEAYVYAWDGLKATGSALFQQGPFSTTNNGGADGMEEFTINTGGVQLIGGAQYVLFFSASNLFDGSNGTATWGTVNPGANAPDTYAGGNFVYMNNASSFSNLTAQNWVQRSGDLAFKADFSSVVVPEPSTLPLLSLGVAGLATRRGRRPRQK